MTVEWTTEDQTLAARRGWGLHGVFDARSGKYLGLQAFSADGIVFHQIRAAAQERDALCIKALRAIFQSRLPANKGKR